MRAESPRGGAGAHPGNSTAAGPRPAEASPLPPPAPPPCRARTLGTSRGNRGGWPGCVGGGDDCCGAKARQVGGWMEGGRGAEAGQVVVGAGRGAVGPRRGRLP